MKLDFNIPDSEERGVSPVIGVILMVAITVILAAVIGTFVLGLGDQVSTSAPQATLSFSCDGTNGLTVDHNGGDALTGGDVTAKSSTFTVSFGSDLSVGGTNTLQASPATGTGTVTLVHNPSDQIIAEEEVTCP